MELAGQGRGRRPGRGGSTRQGPAWPAVGATHGPGSAGGPRICAPWPEPRRITYCLNIRPSQATPSPVVNFLISVLGLEHLEAGPLKYSVENCLFSASKLIVDRLERCQNRFVCLFEFGYFGNRLFYWSIEAQGVTEGGRVSRYPGYQDTRLKDPRPVP